MTRSRSVVQRSVRLDATRRLMPTSPSQFQELFLSKLEGNRLSRAKIPNVAANIEHLVAERLLGSRAESTWSGLSSVWKQFLVFSDMLYTVDGDVLGQDWKIMMFLETKLQAKLIQPPSAYTYLKELRMSSQKLDIPMDLTALHEYGEALKRGGALRSENQAPPAHRADVEASLLLLSEDEGIGMIVAWKTSSRIGEIQYLLKENFQWIRDDLWAITFPFSKSDPYRLGTTLTTHLGTAWSERLRAAVDALPPGGQLSTLTTRRAAAVLGRVRQELTAHSIKRGALTAMLLAGAPLNLIQIMAKHKDLDMLLHYLPRVEVALAMGAHECTRLI